MKSTLFPVEIIYLVSGVFPFPTDYCITGVLLCDSWPSPITRHILTIQAKRAPKNKKQIIYAIRSTRYSKSGTSAIKQIFPPRLHQVILQKKKKDNNFLFEKMLLIIMFVLLQYILAYKIDYIIGIIEKLVLSTYLCFEIQNSKNFVLHNINFGFVYTTLNFNITAKF